MVTITSGSESWATQMARKYRPASWDSLIGQNKIRSRTDYLRPRGLGGRTYLLSGSSGTGKTTIAYLIAEEIAEGLNIVELDAGRLTEAKLAELESHCFTFGLGEKTGRVFIINEAHRMSAAAIGQLLTWSETIPNHVAIILTTTTTDGAEKILKEKEDGAALKSRSVDLPLARRGLAEEFARHALEIARAEQLPRIGEITEKDVLRYVKGVRNNFRATLQALESGALLTFDE